jgi:hypothetical protein
MTHAWGGRASVHEEQEQEQDELQKQAQKNNNGFFVRRREDGSKTRMWTATKQLVRNWWSWFAEPWKRSFHHNFPYYPHRRTRRMFDSAFANMPWKYSIAHYRHLNWLQLEIDWETRLLVVNVVGEDGAVKITKEWLIGRSDNATDPLTTNSTSMNNTLCIAPQHAWWSREASAATTQKKPSQCPAVRRVVGWDVLKPIAEPYLSPAYKQQRQEENIVMPTRTEIAAAATQVKGWTCSDEELMQDEIDEAVVATVLQMLLPELLLATVLVVMLLVWKGREIFLFVVVFCRLLLEPPPLIHFQDYHL